MQQYRIIMSRSRMDTPYMYCKVDGIPMDPGNPAQMTPTGAGPLAAIEGMPSPKCLHCKNE
jgi:hypothetical protein